ncbi:serine hydrolase domain-containing protein [Crocinitomix algicola]|uniref:serine hydrolase domain-containing protein n=1 Tax=Crocinitomix algicola TaxID=1740263 RepID=UPI0008357C9F|nr:serine hydrolase domain-containing protein [Crocinitomix algicola]
MKNINTLLIALVLVFYGQAQDYNKTKYRVEKLLIKELKNKSIHNAFLAVYSPSNNIDWNFVKGTYRNGDVLDENTTFHSASIGKTFTATAIAILYDQNELHFDDKISAYLPDSTLNGLHILGDTEYSHDITIAQLLQHTSGIPDYYEDVTKDDSPNASELLFSDTAKFWSPNDMINLSKEKMEPNFKPGASYHYSDTEYILLGLIIEKISGLTLSEFYDRNFFRPLSMKYTHLHLRSNSINNNANLAELYAENIEISTYTSLSLDWAGGGLATTSTDLNKFQTALHNGQLIRPETFLKMQTWIPETKGMYYGFGLRKINLKELFPTLPNLNIIGHTGSTASFMFYCPELDVYLSGSLNQMSEVKKSVLLPIKVLIQIRKAKK